MMSSAPAALKEVEEDLVRGKVCYLLKFLHDFKFLVTPTRKAFLLEACGLKLLWTCGGFHIKFNLLKETASLIRPYVSRFVDSWAPMFQIDNHSLAAVWVVTKLFID